MRKLLNTFIFLFSIYALIACKSTGPTSEERAALASNNPWLGDDGIYYHTTTSGDYAHKIASTYNITVDELRKYNGMESGWDWGAIKNHNVKIPMIDGKTPMTKNHAQAIELRQKALEFYQDVETRWDENYKQLMSHLDESFLRDEYVKEVEEIQARYLNEKKKIERALHAFDKLTESRDYPYYITSSYRSASVYDFGREYNIDLDGVVGDLSTLKRKVEQKSRSANRHKEIIEYYSKISGPEIVEEIFLKKFKKLSLHNAEAGIHAERVRELRLLRDQLIQAKYEYEDAYYDLGAAIKKFDGEDYYSLFAKESACKNAARNILTLYFSAKNQISEYEEFLKVNKLDDFK